MDIHMNSGSSERLALAALFYCASAPCGCARARGNVGIRSRCIERPLRLLRRDILEWLPLRELVQDVKWDSFAGGVPAQNKSVGCTVLHRQCHDSPPPSPNDHLFIIIFFFRE